MKSAPRSGKSGPIRLSLALLALLSLAATALADPLDDRVESVLGEFNQAQTGEARTTSLERMTGLVDTLESSGRRDLAAQVLESAGLAAFRLGRRDEAMELWTRGLAHARAEADRARQAALTNSLAIGYSAQGDLESGIEMFGELLPLREALGDRQGLGVTWSNLANAYYLLGRYPEALEANLQSIEHLRAGGKPHMLRAPFGIRAEIMSQLGRITEALAWSDSTLARRLDADLEGTGTSLGNRSRYLHMADRTEEALAAVDTALTLVTKAGARTPMVDFSVMRAEFLVALDRGQEAIALCREARIALEERGGVEYLLYCMNVEGLAHIRTGDLDAAESVLQDAVLRYEEWSASLQSEASAAGSARYGTDPYSDMAHVLLLRDRPEEAWTWVERGRARAFQRFRGQDTDPPSLEDVQEHLKTADAHLLEFSDPWAGTLSGFVVSGSELSAAIVGPLQGAVDDARAAAQALALGEDDAATGPLERLSRYLAPALEMLPPEAGRLIVTAPGLLAGLPLETLVLPDGTLLGERFAVSYVPSAQALLELMDRTPSSGSLLAFADPEGSETSSVLPSVYRDSRRVPLPEARKEVKAIAPSRSTILVGGDAVEPAFFSDRAHEAAVIHFATHAVVDPRKVERSALLLSPTADADGLLTCPEISGAPLSADLITLSGCRTGTGYTYLGEGTYGFMRSFFDAGARSVIMSLWDVEDGAARRFMELFYERLRDGEARDEALRNARNAMAGEGYGHRDRSAFVLAGVASEPVSSLIGTSPSSTRSWIWVAVLGLIVGLVVGRALIRR